MGDPYFVTDTKVSNGKPVKITIVLDCDKGVTIDDCGRLSGNMYEVLNPLFGDYTLEVTTPGLDNPLSSWRQYKKNVGREVKVLTTEGRTIIGQLTACSAEGIDLEWKEKKEVKKEKVLFSEIKNTRVQVSFK